MNSQKYYQKLSKNVTKWIIWYQINITIREQQKI